jgi:hypothetical protein
MKRVPGAVFDGHPRARCLNLGTSAALHYNGRARKLPMRLSLQVSIAVASSVSLVMLMEQIGAGFWRFS